MSEAVGNGPAVLVIAHPGHELRLHHWMEIAQPTVVVLTDGSGATGISRLASTTATLANAGAARGPIYGRMTDAMFYDALLARRFDLFAGLVEELTAVMMETEAEYLVSDSAEGYNPAHDVCRL